MAEPTHANAPDRAGERTIAAAATRETGAVKGARTGSGVAATAAVVGVYLAYRLLSEVVRLPSGTPGWLLLFLFVLLSAAGIGLPIFLLTRLARKQLSPGRALLLAVTGLLLALGGFVVAGAPPLLRPVLATASDLGKIVAAGGVGLALAGLLRDRNILVPAGLFAAVADFVVVNFGTVKQALNPANQKSHAVLQAVSAKVPSIHPKLGAGATVGPADFLFLGIFLACAHRFGMNVTRTAWVLTAVLGISLIVAQAGWPVPALAPMSLAFLAVNWREFRLTRDEWIGTVAVVLVAGGLFASYFIFAFGKRG